MSRWLFHTVVGASLAAAVAAMLLLPPHGVWSPGGDNGSISWWEAVKDAGFSVLVLTWPYLLTAGLAVAGRRRGAVQVGLLVGLLLVVPPALWLDGTVGAARSTYLAERAAGEPDREGGLGLMGLGIATFLFVPLGQSVVLLVAGGLGWLMSLRRPASTLAPVT